MNTKNIFSKIILGIVDIAVLAIYLSLKCSALYNWNFLTTLIGAGLAGLLLYVFSYTKFLGIIIKIFFCVAWILMTETAITFVPELENAINDSNSTGSIKIIMRLIIFFFALLVHLLVNGIKRVDDYEDEDDYAEEDESQDRRGRNSKDYKYEYEYKYKYKYKYSDDADEDEDNGEDDEYYEDDEYEDDEEYNEEYGEGYDEEYSDEYPEDDSEDYEDNIDYSSEAYKDNEDYEDYDEGYSEEYAGDNSRYNKYNKNFEHKYEDVKAKKSFNSYHEDYSDYDDNDDDYSATTSAFRKLKSFFDINKDVDNLYRSASSRRTSDTSEDRRYSYSDSASKSNNNDTTNNGANNNTNNADLVARLFIGCNDKASLASRYRSLMKTFHPDTGNGDLEMSQEIQRKYKELLKQFED